MPSSSLDLSSLERFGKQHPALPYGLALLLGISAAFSWSPVLFLPILMLGLIAGSLLRCLLAYFILILTFCSVGNVIRLPSEFRMDGNAYFEVSSISLKSSPIGKKWIYAGKVIEFIPDPSSEKSPGNFPCQIALPYAPDIERPKANRAYKIHGTLSKKSSGQFQLKVKKDTPWYPIEDSWSMAEIRLNAKKEIIGNVKKRIKHPESASFLAGIATGTFDDRYMSFEFSRFGLQHIMAISGFHFAIIAAILNMLLRAFCTKRKATLFLILLLSSYFVFLGTGPSVFRAWLTILIVLAGIFLNQRGKPLNSIGVALFIILLFDPLVYLNLGFQFSFLSTAAILLFFPIMDELLRFVFHKRALSLLVEADSVNKHGYVVLNFLRQALALALAVNLIALPAMLYYFQQFPVMSLIFNLFFPFLVSLSMLLLILGYVFLVIPPIGSLIDGINNLFTKFVLDFTYNMPNTLDYKIYMEGVTAEMLIVYLCFIFGVGILVGDAVARRAREREELGEV